MTELALKQPELIGRIHHQVRLDADYLFSKT